MVQAIALLTQNDTARRVAFLEHADRLTLAEHAELSALRCPRSNERSDAELKSALAYQRRVMAEQGRCVRTVAKASLAARRAPFSGPALFEFKALRRTLETYLAAWAQTRMSVANLESEIDRRGATFAAAAE